MEEKQIVHLKSINRGFDGDSTTYIIDDDDKEIVVSVDWAVLKPFLTRVFKDGNLVASFDDQRYVQPHEALERLGYTVRGSVDFAYRTKEAE